MAPAPAEPEEPPQFEVRTVGMCVEGRRVDIRRGLVKDLKRGRWAIQAKLDLHGMVVEQARRTVQRFLQDAERRGMRALLIVTGKGERSRPFQGVLRHGLSEWLTDDPCRYKVLCFTSARPEDGGPGAFYVLLRRPEPPRLP